jgi:predicted alpha-1,6-mannanase (GH76 family)
MRWYDSNSGLWTKLDGELWWWQSANMLTVLTDLASLDSGVKDQYGSVWENTFNKAPVNNPDVRRSSGGRRSIHARQQESGFLNHNYDDEAWWALAWIAAYDTIGTSKYLDEAALIWDDMHSAWGNTSCGGLPWAKVEGSGALAIENGTAPTDRAWSDSLTNRYNRAVHSSVCGFG